MNEIRGLKKFRSPGGPVAPNTYWKRIPHPKCEVCGLHRRGPGHDKGHKQTKKEW